MPIGWNSLRSGGPQVQSVPRRRAKEREKERERERERERHINKQNVKGQGREMFPL